MSLQSSFAWNLSEMELLFPGRFDENIQNKCRLDVKARRLLTLRFKVFYFAKAEPYSNPLSVSVALI